MPLALAGTGAPFRAGASSRLGGWRRRAGVRPAPAAVAVHIAFCGLPCPNTEGPASSAQVARRPARPRSVPARSCQRRTAPRQRQRFIDIPGVTYLQGSVGEPPVCQRHRQSNVAVRP
jgi:hypothetical protein